MDYIPMFNTLPGIVFYSLIGYVLATTLAYLITPKGYTIEDYRETIRRNRDRKK